MCIQCSKVHKAHKEMVLYIHEFSLKKYIENKCASFESAQIPTRHGTHMCRYHQVIGLKCAKSHEVELSKDVCYQQME